MPIARPPFITALAILLMISLVACQSTPSDSDASASPDANTASQTATDGRSNLPAYPSGEGRTIEETIDDLDAELDASIAVFDGMILDERSKAEAIVADSYDPDDGYGDDPNEVLFEEGDLEEGLPGYGEFPETANDTETDSEISNEEEDEEYAEASSAASDAPGAASSTRGGIPEDIDNGSDDDIVARQIREAAQKETDPALREKLWDEYRKYKNQQSGR